MKKLMSFLAAALIWQAVFAQIETPIRWGHSVKEKENGEILLAFTAAIDNNWNLYATDLPEGGPIATSFVIDKSADFELSGPIKSSVPATLKFDPIFGLELGYFSGKVEFVQVIKRNTDKKFSIKGYVEFMGCDDTRCIPPDSYEFTVNIKAKDKNTSAAAPVPLNLSLADPGAPTDTGIATNEGAVFAAEANSIAETVAPAAAKLDYFAAPENAGAHNTAGSGANKALLWIFIAGFIGGLIALLTPCVFPMIPMTVSVFMKMGDKGSGVKNAVLFGISIIVIYVLLGLAVTAIFGPDALNALSTNPIFNLIFFALLVIFAASFFGAFEMQLPTSWANFFDSKAETSTGWVSILFMAFTLALVSFSCTGPIIGTLLVEAAVTGSTLAPLAGMLGFSVALALPFTVFAMFPSMLNSLPKSGGWLNSVKVVLGFLELALAMKFLSVADLVAHWGLMPREVFLASWIVIFTMLGFYLLGKLKLAHDSDLEYISVTRLFLAGASFVFALWMVPGMWGAPLKSISAFPPPLATQEFRMGTGTQQAAPAKEGRKYSDKLHCPVGIDCYFDLDEAIEAAKAQNKPVLIDFTGHGCVNCRRMEASVLSDRSITEMLSEKYIVASLYVDDRTELPKEEQITIELGGRERTLRTIGNKWSSMQAIKFGSNSQPYYVVVNHRGEQLLPAHAYDLSIENYRQFLLAGEEAFRSGR
jgi:thiol:disulfide interchange protein